MFSPIFPLYLCLCLERHKSANSQQQFHRNNDFLSLNLSCGSGFDCFSKFWNKSLWQISSCNDGNFKLPYQFWWSMILMGFIVLWDCACLQKGGILSPFTFSLCWFTYIFFFLTASRHIRQKLCQALALTIYIVLAGLDLSWWLLVNIQVQ